MQTIFVRKKILYGTKFFTVTKLKQNYTVTKLKFVPYTKFLIKDSRKKVFRNYVPHINFVTV
jgi:hypothetical protein